MAKIFAYCNQKGGVGKTTSVTNIAAHLSKVGYRTLIIDMDSQANATSGLGIEKPDIEFTTYQLFVDNSKANDVIRSTDIENLYIIPSNVHLAGIEIELVSKIGREYLLKNRLGEISNQYDFIFIDCPPSLGLATINSLTASDFLIIPLQCEYYALEGLSQLLNTFQLIKKNLNRSLEIGGVILTMADFRTNLTQQVIEEVRNYFKDKAFKSVIPRSVKLSEAPSFGKPAVLYDPSSRGSKAYVEVTEEFILRFAEEKKAEAVSPVVSETAQESAPETQVEEAAQKENVTDSSTVPVQNEGGNAS